MGYGGYDRTRAYQYAERWWNDHNPQYTNMGVDCTNYVSQILFAGGLPMVRTGKRQSGWWYSHKGNTWSYSWAVAHALSRYLSTSGGAFHTQIVAGPEALDIGDVISYDWQGSGRYDHNTVVTGFDPQGLPLVNAHTVNSHQRFFSYADSYAWTPRTRYLFIHFVDP